MSESAPQNGDAYYSNPLMGTAGAGPPPVLSNARIAGQCRVLHCPVDLNTQTNTNRKYYLCRDHWAAEKILVDGIPQRFCGQCSRFKILTEFDGVKRTCRQCLFLRNTKKRSQRQENLHRAAYGSPLPPYQLDARSQFMAAAAAAAAATTTPLQPGLLHHGTTGYYNNQHSSQQAQLIRQQLQQLQGLPIDSRSTQPPPPSPPPPPAPSANTHLTLNGQTFNQPTGTIDVENLNTILSLINAVGVLGDGHTGNSEADALYYLFQELKTLKQEIESKGHTVACMHAKKRKLAAEQELARANLEVADIEEQLIRVSMLNKQKQQMEREHREYQLGQQQQQQQQQQQHRRLDFFSQAIDQTTRTNTTTTTTNKEPAANTAVHIDTASAVPNITTSPFNEVVDNEDHGSDGLDGHIEGVGGGDGKISSNRTEMLSPPAPETEPKLTRRSSSG